MWNVEEETGYKPQTTFWEDFSIADKFGIAAVRDTAKIAFDEWKNNYIYLTELVMVLNHKIWQHYQTRPQLAQVYNNLWETIDSWAIDNLQGEELEYFYKTLD